MNVLALSAGIGGLELGVRIACPGARLVGACELDSFAASVLVARMEAQAVDPAPVWDDVTTFQGRPWRGVVDLITAGFPCQPWSHAGARRGTDDERWIWPDIFRVIREVRPRFVFLENVPGLITGDGLPEVLGPLASLGYDAEWDVFSAADVGAPQKRERVFILGYARGAGRQQKSRSAPADESEHAGGDSVRTDIAPSAGEDVADADAARRRQDGRQQQEPGRRGGAGGGGDAMGYPDRARTDTHTAPGRPRGTTGEPSGELAGAPSGGQRERRQPRGSDGRPQPRSEELADAGCAGLKGREREAVPGARRGQEGRAIGERRGTELANTASGRRKGTRADGRGGAHAEQLRPLFPFPRDLEHPGWRWVAEEAQELWPNTEPEIRRVADGTSYRLDRPRIRACGNGVVPLVAAVAFRVLADRAGVWTDVKEGR